MKLTAKQKSLLSWVIYLLFLVLAWFAIKSFATVVKVDGHSMDPNLHTGQRVLVMKQAEIKRNSVIVAIKLSIKTARYTSITSSTSKTILVSNR